MGVNAFMRALATTSGGSGNLKTLVKEGMKVG